MTAAIDDMAEPSRAEKDREVIKAFAILGGFFVAATVCAYLYRLDFSAPIPRDGSTLVVGL